MAANKTTAKKSASAKPAKKAPAKATKRVAVKTAKAPAKTQAAPAGKQAVAKKAAPAKKKTAAKKALDQAAPPKKPAAAKKKPAAVRKLAKTPASRAKTAPAPKPAKSTAKAARPKSSLGNFPETPAPAKTRFVPPASSATATKAKPAANGSHSPSFVNKQKQRLLDLRDSLVDSMSGMTRDTIRNAPEGSEASGSGQHQGDAGSDAYDRDFALSVLAKEQDALYEIEQALRRIHSGTYGICEISSRKIPQARLEAIPFARLTVECQAQWEKEYGKRRFRPSNEVGFSGGSQIDDEDSDAVSLDEDED